MEEMLLRVCIVVASLLYIKDHTVFQEQEETIIMDMQQREYLLQNEAAKLQQEVHQVTTGLPHSNQEVSQSRRRSTDEEGEGASEVLQIKDIPDEAGGLTRGNVESASENYPPEKGLQPEIVKSSDEIKNIQGVDPSGHEKEVQHDEQDMKMNEGNDSDQAGAMFTPMAPEKDPEMPVKKIVEDFIEEKITASSQESTENPYIGYLFKFLSVISLIRLLRKCISKFSQRSGTIIPIEDKTLSRSTGILSKMFIPGHKVLNCFYEQCVRVPPGTRSRVCEFVEGFVDELLETARETSNEETDMQIGDIIGVGSLYEHWATGKTIACDLFVPISAPRLHEFDVELWEKKDVSLLGFGRIKMLKAENASNGCPCMDGDPDDEDMLCLLHSHNETRKVMANAIGGPLCQENTPYLSKKQVVRWFRTILIKAWREISHKYEFELGFRSQAAPGALKVRFRSGQTVLFNITPVVQVKASKVYLLSYLSSNQNISDIHWPISFTSYENALLQYFNNVLPDSSCHLECLQIISFLNKQQTVLTGKCGLTSHHLKSTLLHLLMFKRTEWNQEHLPGRLTDMLTFLEQRLQEKKLHHALVGNSLVPKDIGFPKEFVTAKPIDIFLPIALDDDCYLKTVHHVRELVKNTPVLLQEYGSKS